MPSRKSTLDRIDGRVGEVCKRFSHYVHEFERSKTFTGPSVYFHRKAMGIRNSARSAHELLGSDLFFDYLYATLASWGMHRPGRDASTKLLDLDAIKNSLRKQAPAIQSLWKLDITSLSEIDVDETAKKLWKIIGNLRVGKTERRIVANTKALHHVLPSLVPPIDRRYTLNFFYNNPNKEIDGVRFAEMYERFHTIAAEAESKIKTLRRGQGDWNTSVTKTIDNAIIARASELY